MGAWPEAVEYSEAVQTPLFSFADADLRAARPECDALGLPMVYSGNFAGVYHLVATDNSCSWAVKCFTRRMPGLRERYRAISEHLASARLPFTVDIKYVDEGIRIRGEWFPVLKMKWVTGYTLNQFVERNIERRSVLQQLFSVWLKVEPMLRNAQVAHGDLQHGNVMLIPGENEGKLLLRLIDYDGLWTPELFDRPSGENGHASFQHPARAHGVYSFEMDRFPHLVIAAALRALTSPLGPNLWETYNDGENLLFTKTDFDSPQDSPLLQALWDSDDGELRAWAGLVATAVRSPLASAPRLEDCMDGSRRPLLTDEEATTAAEILGEARFWPAISKKSWWEMPIAEIGSVFEEDEERGELLPDRQPAYWIDWLFLGIAGLLVGTTLLFFLILRFDSGDRNETSMQEYAPTPAATSLTMKAPPSLTTSSSGADANAVEAEYPPVLSRISNFEGQWRIIEWNGETEFMITLTAAGDAHKSNVPNATGEWVSSEKEAWITWSDGWRDVLRLGKNGVTKIAFEPGKTWESTPSNTQRAVRD